MSRTSDDCRRAGWQAAERVRYGRVDTRSLIRFRATRYSDDPAEQEAYIAGFLDYCEAQRRQYTPQAAHHGQQ